MPRIIVKTANVDERLLDGGKILRSQMAALELTPDYSLPFRVGLGKRPAYAPGLYDIDPKSFGLSKYGDLELGRYVDLVPYTETAPSAKKV
jgi:hypothetical protein